MVEIKNYIPPLIPGEESKRSKTVVTAEQWNENWNLGRYQGNTNSQYLSQTIQDLLALREAQQAHVTKTVLDAELMLKLASSEVASLFKDVTFNAGTGVLTFYRYNGQTVVFDTAMEKIALDARLDGNDFVIRLRDGTEQRVNLSKFINVYNFVDTATIDAITGEGTITKEISFQVKDGSITEIKLEPTLMLKMAGYRDAANTSATNAATSASSALSSAVEAKSAATSAATYAEQAKDYRDQSDAQLVAQKLLRSDTAMLLNVWSRYANIGYIETNFDAIDIQQPYQPTRKYTKIYDNVVEKIEAIISEEEVENYTTMDGEQIYWTAIGEHPEAYKFFTITDPIRIYQEALLEEEKEVIRERYRVKVRKTIAEYTKEKETWSLDDAAQIPIKISGTGNGTPASEALQRFPGVTLKNAQAITYKDKQGYTIQYLTQNGGAQKLSFLDTGILLHSAEGYVDVKLRQPTLIDFSQPGKLSVTLQGNKTTTYDIAESETQMTLTNLDSGLTTTLKF